MFGKDQLVLSKPVQFRTTARAFTNALKKTQADVAARHTLKSTAPTQQPVKQPEKIKAASSKPAIYQAPANNNLNSADLEDIEITMRQGYLKLEVIKPYATNFLVQVNRLDDLNGLTKETREMPEGKIIFSYSDSKGRWGKLGNSGEKIKVVFRNKNKAGYPEDHIYIYSLKEYNVSPSGVFVQIKGWGNHQELAIVNALKNSLLKLTENEKQSEKQGNDFKEKVIFTYTLSSMTFLADGGWECKLKVIPGKIS